jgi:predicted nucleic acid-binding Zn ribbon protein
MVSIVQIFRKGTTNILNNQGKRKKSTKQRVWCVYEKSHENVVAYQGALRYKVCGVCATDLSLLEQICDIHGQEILSTDAAVAYYES